jgi:hypothetical protein
LENITAFWYILFGNLAANWYIFPRFGILCQEKSGNPERNTQISAFDLNDAKPFLDVDRGQSSPAEERFRKKMHLKKLSSRLG